MFTNIRSMGVALAIVVALLLLTAGTSPLFAQSDWRARYWNNRTLTGDPVLDRQEGAIDHDWGDGSPAIEVNSDDFSARWRRTISVSAGTYRFTATMDDGMRVWVDGNLIIDSWYDSQVHSVSADVTLSSGDHDVRVEYYEAGGGAVARLSWALVSGTVGNWRAEYFNNTSLSGPPVLVRDDPQINFGWNGSPAPGVNADRFSVRWTRSVQFNPGRYRFTVTADDGVRLWVNDQLLIDQWRNQAATTYSAETELPGGLIPIRMEYYEDGGGAVAQLSWTQTAASPGTPGIPGAPTAAWRAEYYNNVDLGGAPALVREDSQIDYNWGSSSPAPNVIGSDRFSVRWSRNLTLNPGRYVFSATIDDGVRLWVNNQLIIDAWTLHTVQTFTGVVDVPSGPVPVVMEYFENTGLAEAHLSWSPTGGTGGPTTPGTPTATMVNARYLNVRSGPGVEFDAFTYLSQGQMVGVIGRDAGAIWIQIRLPDGNTGWASARYLASSYPFASLPIVNP